MANLVDWLVGLWANVWIAVFLYWLPLAFCVFGYTLRTAANYVKDKARRARAECDSRNYSYYPTDTVGTLVGRAVVSCVPVANLWAAMFDLVPEIFEGLFCWLDKLFSQPLVPPRERD